jgi:zinc/manganese transport system ATP-binding protein
VDSKTTAALLELVLQWQREGRTVVAVLHDDDQVRRYFPQTLLLARECIAWGPTAEVLTERNWQRARALAEAWDETASVCDRNGSLNGQDFDSLLAQRLSNSAQA